MTTDHGAFDGAFDIRQPWRHFLGLRKP